MWYPGLKKTMVAHPIHDRGKRHFSAPHDRSVRYQRHVFLNNKIFESRTHAAKPFLSYLSIALFAIRDAKSRKGHESNLSGPLCTYSVKGYNTILICNKIPPELL